MSCQQKKTITSENQHHKNETLSLTIETFFCHKICWLVIQFSLFPQIRNHQLNASTVMALRYKKTLNVKLRSGNAARHESKVTGTLKLFYFFIIPILFQRK